MKRASAFFVSEFFTVSAAGIFSALGQISQAKALMIFLDLARPINVHARMIATVTPY